MKKVLKKLGLQRVIGISVLVLGIVLTILNNIIDTNNILGIAGVLMSIGGLYTWLIKSEKNQLIKLIFGFVALSILFTWIMPSSYFSSPTLSDNGFKRIGLFDVFKYPLLGVYYFTVLVTYLFVLGGFNEILKKAPGYQKIVDNISKIFKGNKLLFTFISMFIFAIITAFSSQNLLTLAFVPFALAIAFNVTNDKVLSFVSTFGGILVGTIGSIFSTAITGSLVSITSLKVTYLTNIYVNIGLFVVAYVLMVLSTILYVKKNSKHSKNEEITNSFIVDKPKNDAKYLGTTIVIGLFVLISIIAFIPWNTVFKLTWVTNFHNWITSFKLFDTTVLTYVLGSTNELGSWDLFGLQSLMLIFALLIAIVNKIKPNVIVESFVTGFKSSCKYVLQFLLIYLIVEFAILFPVVPTIVAWLMHLFNEFSLVMAGFSVVVSSIFGVELQYATQLSANYIAETFTSASGSTLAILYQSLYGLVQFVAPTSLVLVLGLSFVDLSYSKWLKFIWKLLAALLLIIIIALVLITYVF